ncbi:MAG: hypothetical protein PHG00_12910 [Methylococcales bacterium]|nr:hypothetical protein [Methylococcales bacterium]
MLRLGFRHDRQNIAIWVDILSTWNSGGTLSQSFLTLSGSENKLNRPHMG